MASNNAKQTKDKEKKERGGLLAYFEGVHQEFSKVVWPTREELRKSTVSVVVICAVFALGFWLIDTGFLQVLRTVLGITLS